MIRKKKKGQALVEFAIVLVLMLIIVLGTIDWGLYLYGMIILDTAVRDAVRVAVVCTDWVDNYDARLDEIKDIVESRASFLPASASSGVRSRVYVTFTPDINNPDSITIGIASQPYQNISGFLGAFIPKDISTQATMRYEKR